MKKISKALSPVNKSSDQSMYGKPAIGIKSITEKRKIYSACYYTAIPTLTFLIDTLARKVIVSHRIGIGLAVAGTQAYCFFLLPMFVFFLVYFALGAVLSISPRRASGDHLPCRIVRFFRENNCFLSQ